MDTKKIFSNEPQKKGGKDSTRVILTAAGATTVGAAAGYAASQMDETQSEEQLPTEGEETEVIAENTEQQEQSTQPQQSNQQTQPQTNDEIQPIGSQTDEPSGEVQQNTQQGSQNETGIIDDVDPDLIAQEITAVEIDPNDVDMADIIQVDDIDTLYTPDGSEMQVASIHTQDGGQFLMVDVDNDMTFDVITDLEGNPIVQVDSNLTFSDVEDMMDETGGELAYNAEQDAQELAYGGDPEDGILDTLTGVFEDEYEDPENLLAENEVSEDEDEEGFDDDSEEDDSDIALNDEQDDAIDDIA